MCIQVGGAVCTGGGRSVCVCGGGVAVCVHKCVWEVCTGGGRGCGGGDLCMYIGGNGRDVCVCVFFNRRRGKLCVHVRGRGGCQVGCRRPHNLKRQQCLVHLAPQTKCSRWGMKVCSAMWRQHLNTRPQILTF